MKYKVYTRIDTIEKKAGPLVLARTDEGAQRYYAEQDSFMFKNYSVAVNTEENRILCIGEYENDLELIKGNPPNLLTLYDKNETYFIDLIPAGLRPKDMTDTELKPKENKE